MNLNLPEFDFNIKQSKGKNYIFDSLRKKFIVLTPEEWVRQNFVQFLIGYKQFPEGLISIEHTLQLNGMTKRSDIVVFNKKLTPTLIVECKAPGVKITRKVFDQIARYNLVFNVSYLVVTNGLTHYCCRISQETNAWQFIEDIPDYEYIIQNE